MPDARMAEQAVRRFVTIGVVHLGRDRLVAIKTTALSHIAIEGRDLNRLGEIPEGKGGAMAEAVQTFDGVFGDHVTVWCVTVVARSHRLMAAVVPTVILVAHDVAVDTGRGVIREIRCSLGIS